MLWITATICRQLVSKTPNDVGIGENKAGTESKVNDVLLQTTPEYEYTKLNKRK